MKEDTIRKLYEGTIRKMVKDNIPKENANHVLVKSLVSELSTICVLVNEVNEKHKNFDEWYDVIAGTVTHQLKDVNDVDITSLGVYYKMGLHYNLGTKIINHATGKTAEQLGKTTWRSNDSR